MKVLLPIGDASEVLDTMYPFFRIPEAGFEVVVAGREARKYHLVQHEIPPGWDITQETPGYHLAATVAFRDVEPAEYAGLFVSGGRAPEYLRYDEHLLAITRHFFAAAKAGCIRGRRVTTVAKCALDARQGEAIYVDQPVVVDGNLVTARTWHDNTPFLKEFLRLLQARAE